MAGLRAHSIATPFSKSVLLLILDNIQTWPKKSSSNENLTLIDNGSTATGEEAGAINRAPTGMSVGVGFIRPVPAAGEDFGFVHISALIVSAGEETCSLLSVVSKDCNSSKDISPKSYINGTRVIFGKFLSAGNLFMKFLPNTCLILSLKCS